MDVELEMEKLSLDVYMIYVGLSLCTCHGSEDGLWDWRAVRPAHTGAHGGDSRPG